MNSTPVVEYDCAIVLGAKVEDDGAPSPALARRVAHAAALFHAGRARRLLMSGGPVSHPIPEALIMRDLAISAGIPAQAIWVETQSFNTIGNARFSIPIITEQGWNSLVVVSDSYHLLRSAYIFRRFGRPVALSGARPNQVRPEWIWAHMREFFAIFKTVWLLSRRNY